MSTLQNFEDLDCWKMAREEANLIYLHFWKIKDFAFRDQIIRAAISVMNNIAEWFGRWSPKEKIQFMNIAHGSLLEVRSMIYLALDQKYLQNACVDEILEHNLQTKKMLQGFLRYLHDFKNNN